MALVKCCISPSASQLVLTSPWCSYASKIDMLIDIQHAKNIQQISLGGSANENYFYIMINQRFICYICAELI